MLQNPLNVDSLPELLTAVLDAVVYLGTLFLILMLIFVGFKFVTAQGAEAKIKEARQALLWTVVGGILLLGAKGIALVVEATAQSL